AQIIYTLWWTAWSNDIYSGSPVVDDSAFDGSICIPTFSGCADLTSQVVAIEPRSGTKTSTNMILPPEGFTTTNTVTFTGFPPYNFGANVIFTDDMYGYSVTKHTGPTIYFYLIDPSGTTVSLDFVGDES